MSDKELAELLDGVAKGTVTPAEAGIKIGRVLKSVRECIEEIDNYDWFFPKLIKRNGKSSVDDADVDKL